MKRDLRNNFIFGVCSGIAKSFDVDVTLVRTVFLLLVLLGFGMPIIIYAVLAVIMPIE